MAQRLHYRFPNMALFLQVAWGELAELKFSEPWHGCDMQGERHPLGQENVPK